MKQTLVLSPGLPRSGTTSLWKLLGLQGFKEPHYLSVLANETDYPSFYPESMSERFCNYMIEMNERRLGLHSPYSLDTYSEYIAQQRFDFSQSYWWISERFLEKIKKSLDCNIKIILLLFIRRFTIFSDYRPHGLFDSRYYTYYLKPIDE